VAERLPGKVELEMRKPRSLWLVLSALAVGGMLTAYAPLPSPAAELSVSEADGLAFMREEEKLAHDLYTELYDLYGLPVFANIARSESQHMQVVLELLDAYGLKDPAAGKLAGEFLDPTLQALYDDLLARARASQEEALRVAALVEETDILDLQQRMAQTDQADLVTAYGRLLQASGQHLRVFSGQIERLTGEEYAPQLMTADEYDRILSAPGAGTPGAMRGRGRGRAR
jgi:hypothetical protein